MYQGNENSWCVSKFPNYFSPSITPTRSTGCCLIEQYGSVDYYTAPENVKIFGYKTYCGDGTIDIDEECDGEVAGTCASNGASCNPGYSLVGAPGCVNCQIDVGTPYCNCTLGGTSGS